MSPWCVVQRSCIHSTRRAQGACRQVRMESTQKGTQPSR
ncbi:hypothetical protein APV28_1653 [Comamonas testosteroni]|nr:hypothetical protein APV28_1653 [Comamonas testosteroni]